MAQHQNETRITAPAYWDAILANKIRRPNQGRIKGGALTYCKYLANTFHVKQRSFRRMRLTNAWRILGKCMYADYLGFVSVAYVAVQA